MSTPAKVGDPLLTIATNRTLQLWAGSGAALPVLVANLSTTANIYVGYSNSISPAGSNVVPIGPQQAFAFDGSRTLYIVALANTPVLVLPGATTYFSGNISITNSNLNVTVTGGTVTATVTGSVSIVGTPTVNIAGTPTVTISGTPNVTITGQTLALDVSAATVVINPVAGAIFAPGGLSQIGTMTTQSVAANGSASSAVINVSNYLSYDLNISAFTPSQGTNGAPLIMQCLLQWFADAGATIPVYQERWWGWLGNAVGTLAPIEGSGPMHGPYMRLTVFNGSPALTAYTLQAVTIWGTQRTSSQSDWRQTVPSAMTTGLSVIGAYGLPGDDNMLFAMDNANLGVSQTLWQPFPLCTGLQYLRFNSGTALGKSPIIGAGMALTSGQLGTGGAGSMGILWSGPSAASTEVETTYYTDHSPAYMIVVTTVSGATVSMRIVGSRGSR
jgi:hypothetical protein